MERAESALREIEREREQRARKEKRAECESLGG